MDCNIRPREPPYFPDVRINVYQMTKIGRLNYTAGVQFPRKQLPDTGAELLPS